MENYRKLITLKALYLCILTVYTQNARKYCDLECSSVVLNSVQILSKGLFESGKVVEISVNLQGQGTEEELGYQSHKFVLDTERNKYKIQFDVENECG